MLFRTESGEPGALEDACAHRGIPLSRGAVRGETIRCNYHHFAYDRGGQCVSIPKMFGCDDASRCNYAVRRFFVREALGLVWISVEDAPDAVFPIENEAEAEANQDYAFVFNDVDGDIRVWMDHHADVDHAAFTHVEWYYPGSAEAPPDVLELNYRVTPDMRYPVMDGFNATLRPVKRARFWMYYAQAQGLSGLARGLLGGAAAVPEQTGFRVDVLSPVCIRLHFHFESGFGKVIHETVVVLNPLSPGKVCVFILGRTKRRSHWLERAVGHVMTRSAARQHIVCEDAPFLGPAKVVDAGRFRLTPADRMRYVASRAMLARYLDEKAKLYPSGSMLHDLCGAAGLAVPDAQERS